MNFKSTLIIGVVALAAAAFGQSDPSKLEGHPAPSFKMTDTSGRVLDK